MSLLPDGTNPLDQRNVKILLDNLRKTLGKEMEKKAFFLTSIEKEWLKYKEGVKNG